MTYEQAIEIFKRKFSPDPAECPTPEEFQAAIRAYPEISYNVLAISRPVPRSTISRDLFQQMSLMREQALGSKINTVNSLAEAKLMPLVLEVERTDPAHKKEAYNRVKGSLNITSGLPLIRLLQGLNSTRLEDILAKTAAITLMTSPVSQK